MPKGPRAGTRLSSRSPSRSPTTIRTNVTAPRPSQNRMDRTVEVGFISGFVELGQGIALQGRAPARRLELACASPRARPAAVRGRPRRRAGAAAWVMPISSSTRGVQGRFGAILPQQHLLGEGDLAGEQRADGLAAVDALDGLADERRDGQGGDLRDALALGQRDRVGQDDLAAATRPRCRSTAGSLRTPWVAQA